MKFQLTLTSSHLTDRVDLTRESVRSYTLSTAECSHLLLARRLIYIVRMSTRRISTRKDADDVLVFPVVCAERERERERTCTCEFESYRNNASTEQDIIVSSLHCNN